MVDVLPKENEKKSEEEGQRGSRYYTAEDLADFEAALQKHGYDPKNRAKIWSEVNRAQQGNDRVASKECTKKQLAALNSKIYAYINAKIADAVSKHFKNNLPPNTPPPEDQKLVKACATKILGPGPGGLRLPGLAKASTRVVNRINLIREQRSFIEKVLSKNPDAEMDDVLKQCKEKAPDLKGVHQSHLRDITTASMIKDKDVEFKDLFKDIPPLNLEHADTYVLASGSDNTLAMLGHKLGLVVLVYAPPPLARQRHLYFAHGSCLLASKLPQLTPLCVLLPPGERAPHWRQRASDALLENASGGAKPFLGRGRQILPRSGGSVPSLC